MKTQCIYAVVSIILLVLAPLRARTAAEFPLDEYDKGRDFISIGISPNGDRCFVRYTKKGMRYLQIADVRYGPFSFVDAPYFNAAGKPIISYNKNNDQYYLYNGKTYGPFRESNLHIGITTGSANPELVFTFEKNGSKWLQVRDTVHGPYDHIDIPAHSRDFSVYGYSFILKGRRYVQINERTFGPYEFTGLPYINPDGSLFIFGYSDKGKNIVRVNDSLYESKGEARFPAFSKTGKRFAFVYQNADGFYIRKDDGLSGPFPYRRCRGCSEDAERYWCEFQKEIGGESYLHINGGVFGPFRINRQPVFSADGSRYIFDFVKDGNWFLNVSGAVSGPYDWIPSFAFNDDMSRIMHIDHKKDGVYVQTAYKTYGPYLETGRPATNADLSITGFLYKERDRYYVRINENVHGPFDFDYCNLTTDNFSLGAAGQFAFSGTKGEERFVQVNGKRLGPFSEDPNRVHFSDDGSHSWFTYTEGNYRYIKFDDVSYGPYEKLYIDDRNPDSTANDRGAKFLFFNYCNPGSYISMFDRCGEYFAFANGRIFGPLPAMAEFTVTKENRGFIAYIKDHNAHLDEVGWPISSKCSQ